MAENERLDVLKNPRWLRVMRFIASGPQTEIPRRLTEAMYRTLRSVGKQIPLEDLLRAATNRDASLAGAVSQCRHDFAEMLDSQERMLQRLGRPCAPREAIIPAYTAHLERVHQWLQSQPHIAVLRVRYKTLVERPETEAGRVNEFLGGRLDVSRAVGAVDPSLYRNRTAASEPSGSPS